MRSLTWSCFKRVCISFSVALSASLLLALSCSPAAAPTPTATKAPPTPTLSPATRAPATVELGTFGSISDAGILIALEKGYFIEQGIDLQVTSRVLPEFVPLLLAGNLDVAGTSASAGFLNAVERGITVKIVADKGSNAAKHGFAALVVRKDLVDSGEFKGYSDLKGRTLATAGFGSGNDHQLIKALEWGGVVAKDAKISEINKVVKIVELGLPEMAAALKNKAIDAALLLEPVVTQAVAQGIGVRWGGADEFFPEGPGGTVLFSAKFAQGKPELAQRWMVAYLRGARDYNDAFEKNKGRDGVISILTKQTAVKDPALFNQMSMPWINPNGFVNSASISHEQDWFLMQGFVTKKVDLTQLIDNQFVEHALQQLGRYE